MVPDNHPLKKHAGKLQALITAAEFTDGQGNSMSYADGFEKNLKLLKEAQKQNYKVSRVNKFGLIICKII